ncbi:response regulator [Aureivirga marina]|uniref:response regulator n=1 Tax=Aureivirga marina TaxID=1182451 RepID=UPI0018C9DD2C|nr:response regulator [Aureivirga marina]
MFKKVLLAEDKDVIIEGLQNTFKRLNISEFDKIQYCDEAFQKVQKSFNDNSPYDLLITDLSFEENHVKQNLKSGEDLVKAIRNKYQDLPIIVFSVEDKIERARRLIQKHNVNAYVCKGRYGLDELGKAIQKVFNNEIYLSQTVSEANSTNDDTDLNDYDIKLLSLLSEGFSQPEIRKILLKENITPNSLSTIEKKIIRLKEIFGAKNPTNLVSITKDLGVI